MNLTLFLEPVVETSAAALSLNCEFDYLPAKASDLTTHLFGRESKPSLRAQHITDIPPFVFVAI